MQINISLPFTSISGLPIIHPCTADWSQQMPYLILIAVSLYFLGLPGTIAAGAALWALSKVCA